MDPASPTSEHLHPSIVLHCLCVRHLLSLYGWGCGWAWEVSRPPLSPALLPLCPRGYTCSASVSPLGKHSLGGCFQGLLHPVFATRLPASLAVGQGAEGQGERQEASVQTASPRTALLRACCGTPLSVPAPGTGLHRGTAVVWHLPGAVQYLSQWQERAGDSETGMGTHSPPWVTQPWGHGIWPCLMARCGGGSCQK